MKLLWLCNMMPGAVKNQEGGGLWMDDALARLRRREDLSIHILFPGNGERGCVEEGCSYGSFVETLPYRYFPQLEETFQRELKAFQPDVIHIWGAEYGHTLAMINAAESLGLLQRVVVSIQGLCTFIARHYTEGIPERVQRGVTFRDLIRRDNIAQQRKKFEKRGALEIQALKKVEHVIGRTDWDRACVGQINPEARYHFCNETMRPAFYESRWRYHECVKHRIFASSCVYPVKGFHYLLEAFAQVLKQYPDATLAVPGRSFLSVNRFRRSGYQKYLADLAVRLGAADRILFLGGLGPKAMAEAYLQANVFVLPSTVENSPNSLAEAMLLGVPCVASHVGGVTTMLKDGEEGLVYPASAPYMLASYVERIFAMEEKAEALGDAAARHAAKTHDPEKNLQTLEEIYSALL